MWVLLSAILTLCKATPLIMYGTAWKGPHAEQNVLDAFNIGYRAFDSANVYPASYNETAMGVSLERLRTSGVPREEMLIQTKFTPGVAKMPAAKCPSGPWDPTTCMYDKNANLATQVEQSAQTSLMHLRVDKLDSIVLHESRQPWDELVVIWRALEKLYDEGKTSSIGLSHIHDPKVFRRLMRIVRIKPSFVQHPIFARNRWDEDIRKICYEHGIIYQAYSLNHKENDFVYLSQSVINIARRLDFTPRQIIVGFVTKIGLMPLVGPQDPIKMARALAAAKYVPDLLTEEDVSTIMNIAFANDRTVSESGRRVTARNRNLEGDAARVRFSMTNNLETDIYFAWQTQDHSKQRTELGMHVEPSIIKAGDTQSINTFHRHGFYFWDASEGKKAPLYREGDSKRWVRRVRANAFISKQDVVIDQNFHVEVVNLAPMDKRLSVPLGNTIGIVRGGGGTMSFDATDGMKIKIRSDDMTVKIITLSRHDGDPQLLSLGVGESPEVAPREHLEL